MRYPNASDPELMDAVRRYVIPGEGEIKRYLKLLHGNFVTLEAAERADFLRSLAEDAEQITDHELGVLLDSEWRSRITAAWLIGLSRREKFRGRLGELLLASELTYAGQGYCFALARLGTAKDAELLVAYLDRYLRRPDCRYDQHWALGALQHIDERLRTNHATQFTQANGLWEQWARDGHNPADEKERIDKLCSFADQAFRTAGADRGVSWRPELLADPWIRATPEQESRLTTELRAELGPGHVLEGRPANVIARCEGCDHVFARIDETPTSWAVVHLTWTGQPDQAPWPITEVFNSLSTAEAELAEHEH
ncbi:DUF6000 family protein [Streptomyces sp. NPDC051243]|uniref:DUF6000 family protein n=1 Tax=Streptomyces sp. NPDC051243 TaxID=3365646 RepID=UPI0037AA8D52